MGSATMTKVIGQADKHATAGMSRLRQLWSHEGVVAARGLASEVAGGMHLKTGGFALKAGLMGAAGGGAGYAYGQGRGDGSRDAIIGAGMGVLGAVAHSGIRSSYRAGARRWQEAILESRGLHSAPGMSAKAYGPMYDAKAAAYHSGSVAESAAKASYAASSATQAAENRASILGGAAGPAARAFADMDPAERILAGYHGPVSRRAAMGSL